MIKNIIILILLVVAGAAGYFAWDQYQTLEETEGQIAELEAQVAAERETTTDLQESLGETRSSLQSIQDSTEKQLENLREALASRDELVGKLENRLEPLQDQLKKYQDQVGNLESVRDNLQNQVQKLQENLGGKNEQVENLKNQLSRLKTSFASAQDKLSNLTSKIVQSEPEQEAAPTETMDSPEVLPLSVSSQAAGFLGNNRKVTIRNNATKDLEVEATFARPESTERKTVRIVLPANQSSRLDDSAWTFKPGDQILIKSSGYETLNHVVE